MSPPNNRSEILVKLRETIKSGNVIVGAGAGIGLSAKFIEQGGGDLIIIYNSGRYRMAGRGSLAGLMPYGNANDVVLEMVSRHPLTDLLHCQHPYRLVKCSLSSTKLQYWQEYAPLIPSGTCFDFSNNSKTSDLPASKISPLSA